jgi:CheY-like chemotaxis protein
MLYKSEQQPVILVVDDSVENLQVLSALLKDFYRIKIAKSGEKALEILNQDAPPDLILLDVMMPGMDGFEVCKAVKANPFTQKIPVIFITALDEVMDETKGFRSGGADFITKPFNPDIVLARIKTHLELQAERLKSEALLRVLLPENVISDLISKGSHTPEIHENVSILFCDFVGFTSITTTMTPVELIEELSSIFSEFDEICSRNEATRIKTIGDAYMAVCGLNGTHADHAARLSRVGLGFIEFLKKRNLQPGPDWICRIGIHSGSVIGGIVGKTRFVYDIMGDSVNVAARVESNGRPMRVAITQETLSQISYEFEAESIGEVHLKGKGETPLFLIKD